MHFVLAIEGSLRVRASHKARWSSAAGVLTSPDCLHAVDARGVEVLLVFLEPESDAGAMLRPAIHGPMRFVSREERAALVQGVDPMALVREGANEWARNAARTLGLEPKGSRVPVHPRVREVLSLLRSGDMDGAVSLDALADAVGLSPGRLMHVFTESIGIPLRPYLAWLRLQRAAGAIMSGASMTEAAYAAGFADAAHMTRTFVRMLGVPPSQLRPLRCSQLVQDT